MIKALHLTGDHELYTSRGSFLDADAAVVASSCDAIMLPVIWGDVQPVAGAPFSERVLSALDGRVAVARAHGLRVGLMVGGFPGWVTSDGFAPEDLSVRGPWAGWVRMILARYAGRVGWVCPLNEPNWGFRHDQRGAAVVVARLMRLADELASGIPGAPKLLMPATLDCGGWETFTDAVLVELEGWVPRARFGWAHHAYGDAGDGIERAPLREQK